MDTCDISLVKEENVELIKTEPQNEDEFDMCGQSGIKTEDETDVPYNVDGVVKTEVNFYDSCVGIMKSTPDHFTLENKYQMLGKEGIVLRMEENRYVKPKIVIKMLKKEGIVLRTEVAVNVKLKIALRRL
ncbi:unnamed protein product, partial [Timema podura]|nr:unnamed protein product [Timema podura]